MTDDGAQANGYSEAGGISADGRFVVFSSYASNLVPGDTNGEYDVFVHDRRTGHNRRVTISRAGLQANSFSSPGAISADGRFVTFTSWASNLVPGDTNDAPDVFVYDRWTSALSRVSVSSVGAQAEDYSEGGAMSADGRFVVFYSYASNLVRGDTNGEADVFVRDQVMGTTTRVSVTPAGRPAHGMSWLPSISADGRWVTFVSYATDLVPGDSNNEPDVFLCDRRGGVVRRVSVGDSGLEANSTSDGATTSADGRLVAFSSAAWNLVPGDANMASDVFVRVRSR